MTIQDKFKDDSSLLKDYFKAASTSHEDFIKTSSILSPSILTKDNLQAAKTSLEQCQYLKTTYRLFQGTFKITLKLLRLKYIF